MASASEFLAQHRFAKFKDISTPEEVQEYLDIAESIYCPANKWGKNQVEGCYMFAAHSIMMNSEDTAIAAGTGAEIANGGAATPRQPHSSPIENFDFTDWGRQFKLLRHRVALIGCIF